MSKKNMKKTTIKGSTEKPRLSVFRSRTNIYAQIVDDNTGLTICSASSLKEEKGTNTELAHAVGKTLADVAKKKKVSKIVFDRGRYVYKGRVKALAEGAREGGLEF